jgi:bifunctional DNA-binding transcriptional regulator/antitoxin component of YhaV-PrlF toxin-antitoxin module
MRITGKGRVTIPRSLRLKAGMLPETEVDFANKNGKVFVVPSKTGGRRGRNLINRMAGSATVRMSTEEIMALTRGKP